MKLERVTFSAFADDVRKHVSDRINAERMMEIWNGITIPERKTKYSAGYDIPTPIQVTIPPHSGVVVPTGLKASFNEDEKASWHFQLFIRSSIGINKNVVLQHGTGVIDSDFADGKTDGDMMLALYNRSDNLVKFEAGERIAQGIFLLHGIVEGDKADKQRVGGIGSTNDD